MQLKKFQNIKNQNGSEIIEFALVLPIVLALIFGIVLFGWLFNNYLTIAYSSSRGARFIEMSRGYVTSPCTSIMTEILGNAITLTPANVTVDVQLGTVTGGVFTLTKDYPIYTKGSNNCSSSAYDTAMATDFGSTTKGSIYDAGTITVSYTFINFLSSKTVGSDKVGNINFNLIAPTLSSTTPFIIE